MSTAPSLATLDWVLLAVLAVSAGVGLWRGLVFELMSLAGWLVAWLCAQWWGPLAALKVAGAGVAPGPGAMAAGYAGCFFAALLACALLARLARLIISATPLRLVDRGLGAAFGVLRGLLVLLVLATGVAMTPVAHWPGWQASRGAAWLAQAVDTLKPLWPARGPSAS